MIDPKAVDPREDNEGDETVAPTTTPGGVYDVASNKPVSDTDDDDKEATE